MGGDVVGQGSPENPGSDGASPYQGASPFLPPIVLVLVLVSRSFDRRRSKRSSLNPKKTGT